MWFTAALFALVGCDAGSAVAGNDPTIRTEDGRPTPTSDETDVCGMNEYRASRIIIDAAVTDENEDYHWAPGDALLVTGRLVNPSLDMDLWYPTAELRVLVAGEWVDTQYANFYASLARTSFPLQWRVVLPEGALDGQEVSIGIAATTLNCADFPARDAQFVLGEIDTEAP